MKKAAKTAGNKPSRAKTATKKTARGWNITETQEAKGREIFGNLATALHSADQFLDKYGPTALRKSA